MSQFLVNHICQIAQDLETLYERESFVAAMGVSNLALDYVLASQGGPLK